MTRPLMQYGVGQLEEMFIKGKADPKVLKQLESELQHRQVPRAVALLADVQAAMHGGASAPQPVGVPASPPERAPAPVAKQPDLWENPATPHDVAPLLTTPVRTATPAVQLPELPPAAKPSSAMPVMPLDDAYKALKATPGSTWESIEQTRCTLVQQSHPSRSKSLSAEKRAQVLAEASRVNAAYATLSRARCGRRAPPSC